MLFSTNHRYGYTTNVTWQKKQWTANYNISEILSPNRILYENYCFKSDPASCALNLLNQGTFFSSFSLGYGFPLGNVSVFYSENNYYNSQKLYTYGVNFITALHQSSSGSWQLNLNASRRQVETSVFATITYNFNDAHKSGNVGMGYGHFRNNYSSYSNLGQAANRVNGNGLTTQGNVFWHKSDDTNYGYTIGLQGNTDPLNKTVGATYDISKSKFHANAYVTNYTDTIGNYSQYGGVFNTRYAWAQHKSALGGGILNDNTGIIVRVNAPDPQATFDVYAEDKIVLHLHANRNYLIKLQAYKTWHISVSDTSENLYYLSNKERVITLYPGNIQTLNWNASRMIALGGRLINAQNNPIENAVIKGVIGFAMTDTLGYFQANSRGNVKQLTVYSATEQCTVKIPSIGVEKNSIYLGELPCNTERLLPTKNHTINRH